MKANMGMHSPPLSLSLRLTWHDPDGWHCGLAVSVSLSVCACPVVDVSFQAREGIYQLSQIMLHQRCKETQPGCRAPMEMSFLPRNWSQLEDKKLYPPLLIPPAVSCQNPAVPPPLPPTGEMSLFRVCHLRWDLERCYKKSGAKEHQGVQGID